MYVHAPAQFVGMSVWWVLAANTHSNESGPWKAMAANNLAGPQVLKQNVLPTLIPFPLKLKRPANTKALLTPWSPALGTMTGMR